MVGKTIQEVIEGSVNGGDNHAIIFKMTDGSIWFVKATADYNEPACLTPIEEIDQIPSNFIKD